jgi:hypothetical protein
MNDNTSPKDNARTVDFTRRTIRNEGVNAMLEKHNLDAIAILTDSPISSIAAATGAYILLSLLDYFLINQRLPGLHNASWLPWLEWSSLRYGNDCRSTCGGKASQNYERMGSHLSETQGFHTAVGEKVRLSIIGVGYPRSSLASLVPANFNR